MFQSKRHTIVKLNSTAYRCSGQSLSLLDVIVFTLRFGVDDRGEVSVIYSEGEQICTRAVIYDIMVRTDVYFVHLSAHAYMHAYQYVQTHIAAGCATFGPEH
jgi:hypothetical protein